MPGGNLNKEIFLNTVKSDMANGTTNAEANDKYGTIYWKDTVGIFINAIE